MKFRVRVVVPVSLVALFLLSCASSKTGRPVASNLSTLPLNSCEAVKTLLHNDLEQYQNQVDEASKDYQEEQWRVETADPKASNEKLSQLFVVMQEKTYNKDILNSTLNIAAAIKDLSEKECSEKTQLLRAKQLLETTILTNEAVVKLEKENQDKQDALMNKSNAFRMTVEGEKEPVSKSLLSKKIGSTQDRAQRESLFKKHDSERAKKWMEWGFRDLVNARNAEGVAAGFKNYYEYRFFRAQVDYQDYRKQVQQIKTKLAPKVRKVLKQMGKQSGIKKVEAWDMRYLREKSASGEINELLKNLPETSVLEIAKQFYAALGINIDDYHFLMDLYPRPGKNTHAFAMGVVAPHVNEQKQLLPEPKSDIRFLANLKKPVHWDDASTIIHELGHAIHYGEIRQPLGIFRGFGSVETEAIAMTLERMADSNEFLGSALPGFTGATAEKLAPILKKQAKAAQIEQAFVLLRQVFFSDFENSIYENPDQDYAVLWAKMHKEYWGVEIPEGISGWDVDHFLMAPAYVQSYAIGILMVEQFYDSIMKEFKTSYNSRALGNKLKATYFAPGLEFNYLALTKSFTGKPLTAAAALKLVR